MMGRSLILLVTLVAWVYGGGDKPGTCPVVPAGTLGICVEECANDKCCPGDEKCCSNGCGHVCKTPCETKDCHQYMKCPYGFELDPENCPCCQCADPCKDVTCNKEEICVVEGSVGVCKNPCFEEPSHGPCNDDVTRYYWDKVTHTCQSFVYGGCDCSPNTFMSEKDCLDKCDGACEPLECHTRMFCQYGFELDQFGCPCCQCADPCKGVACEDDEICFVENDKPICVNPCFESPVHGPCDQTLERYYWDTHTHTCESFIYGGCEGSANTFMNKQDCLDQCEGACHPVSCTNVCSLGYKGDEHGCQTCQCVENPCSLIDCFPGFTCVVRDGDGVCVDPCTLDAAPGPCYAHISRYFWNGATSSCESFIYGGCEGNANNFDTEEQCLHVCQPDPCSLPADPGHCKAYIERYFWNANTAACETFIYGGCGGNANNFETEAECSAECHEDVCTLHANPGPCYAYIPRYFWNEATHSCELFIYGGCEGNGNNFLSEAACVRECGINSCSLSPDSGPCLAYFPRYYWDDDTESCEQFIYGGCLGNSNNFKTEAECQDECGSGPKCPHGSPTFVKPGTEVFCGEGTSYDECPSGTYCVMQPSDDFVMCCKCQPMTCSEPCPDGFITDAMGCQTCACANVCDDFECDGRKVCVPQMVVCVTTPCLPVPTCVDLCTLPVDAGPCYADIERYHWDTSSHSCQTFQYGGCEGNSNNFLTKAECLSQCGCTANVQDLPCVCALEGDPMLRLFDKQFALLLKEQKSKLSSGLHNATDTCKFILRAQTDDDYPGKEGQVYLSWVGFSVGVHPNPTKGHYRAIQIFQDVVWLRGPGISGYEEITPPYTLSMHETWAHPVTVKITESGDVVTISTDDCPYKVEFTRGGFDSKVVLSVGARYKPENNNGVAMTGICGDCNDVMDDYRLCDEARTDVSAEPDKYSQMSDSCEDGKHQHKD